MKLGTDLRREDGFTLIETIVAFAILALVVGLAVQVIGNGSFRQRFDQARMTALSHAQSELAALSATGAVSAGTSEGRYDDGSVWRISAEPLPLPVSAVAQQAGPTARPYAVSVEVFAPGAAEATVALKSVVIGISAEAR